MKTTLNNKVNTCGQKRPPDNTLHTPPREIKLPKSNNNHSTFDSKKTLNDSDTSRLLYDYRSLQERHAIIQQLPQVTHHTNIGTPTCDRKQPTTGITPLFGRLGKKSYIESGQVEKQNATLPFLQVHGAMDVINSPNEASSKNISFLKSNQSKDEEYIKMTDNVVYSTKTDDDNGSISSLSQSSFLSEDNDKSSSKSNNTKSDTTMFTPTPIKNPYLPQGNINITPTFSYWTTNNSRDQIRKEAAQRLIDKRQKQEEESQKKIRKFVWNK